MTLASLVAAAMFAIALVSAVRGLVGPSAHDRLVAAHTFMLSCALSAAALGVAAGDAAYLDLAFMAALADALVVLVGYKVLRRRSLQTPLAALDAQTQSAL